MDNTVNIICAGICLTCTALSYVAIGVFQSLLDKLKAALEDAK